MLALTYNTVGRVAPTLLALVICGYLVLRRRGQLSSFWLALYFALLVVFNLGYILGYSLDTPAGGYAWYLACAISFAGAARLQFAYCFPAPHSEKERRAALVVSFGASVAALADYALRAETPFGFNFGLHAYGARYSSVWVPLVSFLCFAWSLVVSLRAAVSMIAQTRKRRLLERVSAAWKTNSDLRAVAYLVLITIAELGVNGVYLLGFGNLISNTALAGIMNVTLLCIFAAYVLVYSSVPSGRTGFLSKLVGICLVAVLSIINVLGTLFQSRDLERFAEERSVLARSSAGAFLRGEAPDPEIMFLLGPDSAYTTGIPETELRQALPQAKEVHGFRFIQIDSARYFIVEVKRAAGTIVAGFRYEEFRKRLHDAATLTSYGMVFSAALILLAFPLLFRASLVLPLRFLLDDLKKLGQGPGTEGATDELGMLRTSFEKMHSLLKETREQLPDFAPHLEEMEAFASTDAGQIIVGNRVLIYRSRAMRRLIEQIERAREYRYPVLVTGETGTGKELAARMLHAGAAAPFVAVNCAALPETLWESEVFGHKKGAFTDAKTDRKGRVAEAGAGTLFFDEIGEMPLPMQAKMLRLLQENQYTPLGMDTPLEAACRFVFATNRDLAQLVREKQFREDLLYRIRVFHIHVPALRERAEDIPDLIHFFAERFAQEHGAVVPVIDPAAMAGLVRYPWPGNIREVENAVVRAMAAGGSTLGKAHFAESQMQPGPAVFRDGRINFDDEVNRYSRALIDQALEMTEGNKTRAAEVLGLKRTTLRYRMRELGFEDSQK